MLLYIRGVTGSVLGAVVTEGLYVIYDQEHNRVGFARSTCPRLDPSAPVPTVLAQRRVHRTLLLLYES